MPKKRKSPKKQSPRKTTQSLARPLGVIDEEEIFGGLSDEEHPEEQDRFARLELQNPPEVGEKPVIRVLPPGVTEANIAGPGQSDPRRMSATAEQKPREDTVGSMMYPTTASPTPSTPEWSSTDSSTSTASPEERWPGDDSPETLRPLDKSVPDHVCSRDDYYCTSHNGKVIRMKSLPAPERWGCTFAEGGTHGVKTIMRVVTRG